MAIDYNGLAQTASLLLGENGKASVFIRSEAAPTIDGPAGTVTAGASTDTAVNALSTKYDESWTPQAVVEEGDQFLILDGRAQMGDLLVIDGEPYRIMQVWPIKPADTFIACKVQIRR